MAFIRNINKAEKTRNTVHKPTNCNYYLFEDSLGNKILQLDTYGSDDQQIPNKVSQSMQFDEKL